ncbi:PEP-CTERM system histidine kinase PrsK [Leptolyngbya sp. 15MV]|nr:PEP-CTERM system histidine kinase PrsK [Leptolyngbya sp. 15MV]
MLVDIRFGVTPQLQQLVLQLEAMFHVLVATGALVLLHNLYVGASPATRQALRWSTVTLAAMWAYDLNLYTVIYLTDSTPGELLALRGLVIAVVAFGLAVGLGTSRVPVRLRPSRAVTFQSLSLLVIGTYLMFMVGVVQSLDLLGADFGRLTQVGFLFFASLAALYWMPSKRLRGWMRVTLIKHLFQHRYDYRAEWLRFTQTIGRTGAGPFGERVVRAMADMTESPSGLLLLPEEDGTLALAARWQWPEIAVPPVALSAELAALIEQEKFILGLDEVRDGADRHGESGLLPEWLLDAEGTWALVPLLHFERLTGVVVLARPALARRLDWEDLDLLRLAGQQLASYIAEQNVQQALMETARFDEFNRRMAFVMHDIKNLASQLGLLARNAERHADNPDFRADMLVTLRKSSEKLSGLLARLGRYGAVTKESRETVDLAELGERLVARFAVQHPVELIAEGSVVVEADPEAIEQALGHLLQNAIEASEPYAIVFLEVARIGGMAVVQVVDAGSGMTPEFVRNGLFKPFVSSKANGFGIGAFEARELVRAMGGRLEVDSREGLGTRFAIRLPLATTTAVLEADGHRPNEPGVA